MLNITVQNLHEKLKSGEIKSEFLIDVRTENEFKMERIFGAKNISLNQIQSKIEELKKLEKIYIYCATGNRSQIACHLLNSAGIENCYNVEGGIEEWKWNNFETEK